MSAPMCDAFLCWRRRRAGSTCFLVPRWTPDGDRNAIHIRRLKDKLGNRSNASSEVEFEDTHAELLGEEGRGIPTIIEMGNYTRLDCAVGSSGLMRQAVAQAIHHARHRTAFQKHLVDHALMTNVLADLAIKFRSRAVLALAPCRAPTRRRGGGDDVPPPRHAGRPSFGFANARRHSRRKRWKSRRQRLRRGVNLARIYREMPVNSIREDRQHHVSRCAQGVDALAVGCRSFDGGDARRRQRRSQARPIH